VGVSEDVWGWTGDDYKPSAREKRNRGGIHMWLGSLTLARKPITGGIREVQNVEEDKAGAGAGRMAVSEVRRAREPAGPPHDQAQPTRG
jgi:hypothetical protein